jgi:hypothetical protein
MKYSKFSAIAVSAILLCSFRLPDAPFEGIWRGTSICQVKNSPCHDETVVYHVSKSNSNTYTVQANKMVNNKEEEMGTLNFIYSPANQTYLCKDSVRNALWSFKIKESKLEGTLMVRGELYRIINVSKQ